MVFFTKDADSFICVFLTANTLKVL